MYKNGARVYTECMAYILYIIFIHSVHSAYILYIMHTFYTIMYGMYTYSSRINTAVYIIYLSM